MMHKRILDELKGAVDYELLLTRKIRQITKVFVSPNKLPIVIPFPDLVRIVAIQSDSRELVLAGFTSFNCDTSNCFFFKTVELSRQLIVLDLPNFVGKCRFTVFYTKLTDDY